ncbi:GNAT family N-acetyltransferase [Leucothrix sargassi]|nr:GNAT family N-acetyltransferase [Leucothrix sargassi]
MTINHNACLVAVLFGTVLQFFQTPPVMSNSMNNILIRDVVASDYAEIVAINAAEVQHTSEMDEARLAALDGFSSYHKVVEVEGKVAAFLLAMDQSSAYENDNFDWFAAQYKRFLYIDRVVVNAAFAGMSLGTKLYQDIFEYARQHDIGVVCCEYNVIPENKPSAAFHDKQGFEEVGTQWLNNKSKKVSLQAAKL